MKELARAFDPSANESRISAEVFLFHKYLVVQACVGVFPESHVAHVIGGLFAAINEKAVGLDLNQDRQNAMEGTLAYGRVSESMSRVHGIASTFSMKGAIPPTGNRVSCSFAKMFVPPRILLISGPVAKGPRTTRVGASCTPSIYL